MRRCHSTAYLAPALALALLLFAAAPGAAHAQDGAPAEAADTVWHLVLTDGSSFNGHIESRGDGRLVFRTLGGVRLEVELSQVRVLEPIRGEIVGGEVWESDPNATRLFFGPTARSMESGEGYIGLFELFFSFGAVGIGDRIVLAGGTPVIPEAIGEVIYLAPKVRLFSTPGLDLAAGALAFFVTEALDEGSVGIVYGVGTMGDDNDALTVGAGWGFALTSGEASLANDPVLMLGVERRASRRIKLMTENYIIMTNEVFGALSGGLRLMGERFSADLGVAGAFGGGDGFTCCLPVLSAAYSF